MEARAEQAAKSGAFGMKNELVLIAQHVHEMCTQVGLDCMFVGRRHDSSQVLFYTKK